MADFPSDYTPCGRLIWNNRIAAEKSTERRNTIFDQIDAGNGTINYVVWCKVLPPHTDPGTAAAV